mgnify:CR=1 FL=1
MALGLSVTLSVKKRLGIFPRSLEIEHVLHAIESIRNDDFGIPDLAVQRGIRSATRPTFTASYQAEDGVLIVDFGGEAKIFFEVRDRDLHAEYATTLFGPGFHVLTLRFCERLAETANLKLLIDDETDYYDNRDFASLKRNFVQWFGMLLQAVEQNQAGEEHYLCWALDSYHLNEPLPGVVTPAGFFRFEQLREMASQLEQAADDFFLFLPNECRDALHYRNFAMNRLWCDFRFTSDEADRMLGTEIAEALETAAQLDPALPFPRKAYQEVCALLGRPEIDVAALPEDTRFPTVGFRKFPIRFNFANWSIVVPGSVATVCEPGKPFQLNAPGLLVEFSSLRIQLREDAAPNTPPPSPRQVCLNGSSDENLLKEYQLPNGAGILHQTDDPEFPLFLICAQRGQSKNDPPFWQILILTAQASRMEQIDWVLSIAEQCRYIEPDPA